jgi:hypothetical protein
MDRESQDNIEGNRNNGYEIIWLDISGDYRVSGGSFIAARNQSMTAQKLSNLRQRFESTILRKIAGVRINGANAPQVPNTSHYELSIHRGGIDSAAFRFDRLSISIIQKT